MSTRKVNPLIKAVNASITESRANAQRMQQHAKQLAEQRMLIRAQFSDMLKDFNLDKHYLSVTMSGGAPHISITLNCTALGLRSTHTSGRTVRHADESRSAHS